MENKLTIKSLLSMIEKEKEWFMLHGWTELDFLNLQVKVFIDLKEKRLNIENWVMYDVEEGDLYTAERYSWDEFFFIWGKQ